MKMSSEHYAKLERSIKEALEASPNAIYVMLARGWSDMSIRWECYHQSKIDKHEYFIYKDDHIDTALRKIMQQFGSEG